MKFTNLQKHIETIIIIFGILLIIGGIYVVVYYNSTIKGLEEIAATGWEISPEFQEKLKKIFPERELIFMARTVLTDIPREINWQSIHNLRISGTFFGALLIILGLIIICFGLAVSRIVKILEEIIKRE